MTRYNQAKDIAGEKAQWDGRKSYLFAVLTADGSRELDCFYLRPSAEEGYDVVATMWVTQEALDLGFEDQLFRDMKAWPEAAWPFRKAAWRGKEISAEAWKALPNLQAPARQGLQSVVNWVNCPQLRGSTARTCAATCSAISKLPSFE